MSNLSAALQYGFTKTYVHRLVTNSHEYVVQHNGVVLWDDQDKEYKFYDSLGRLVFNVRESMVEAVYFILEKKEK